MHGSGIAIQARAAAGADATELQHFRRVIRQP